MKEKHISRMLAVLLAFVMVFTGVGIGQLGPEMAWASNDVEWAGASNYNAYNNNVTSVQLPKSSNDVDLKWQIEIGHDSWGTFYAGNTVICGEYVYVTGQGKLWKINKTTREDTYKEGVGSNAGSWTTDYLCTDGNVIFVATDSSITAINMNDLSERWKASNSFGYYHPIQLCTVNGTGYLWCNGNVYKADDGSKVEIYTDVNHGNTLVSNNFAWSSGALVNDLFYVTDYYNVYAIDFEKGELKDSMEYSTLKDNASGSVAYDDNSGRLFWGSKAEKKIFSVKVSENGFEANSLISAETDINTVNTPVIYNNTVYISGQNGEESVVQVYNLVAEEQDSLELKYSVGKKANTEGGTVSVSTTQSNPILVIGDDGFYYLYFVDYGGDLYILKDSQNATSGTLEQLADTPNPSNVSYPYSFEQFAIDNDGNIYCYNESGYLFCYGKGTSNVLSNVPNFSPNLSTKERKYLKDSEIKALMVEAKSATGGTITYQWQSRTNDTGWSNIENETSNSYTPASSTVGTSYYRCVATSSLGSSVHTAESNTAKVTITDSEADVTANIKVTISNQGAITVAQDDSLVAQQDIKVTDADNDGLLTVNDALIETHDEFYEGGASAGYQSSFGPYGLSINKLWGDESGAFGYWLNNASCWSLEDEVKNGDYLTAFIYKDQTYWSDAYTLFDKNVYATEVNKEVTLTLKQAGYDSNWNTEFLPCSGASIKVIGSNNSVVPETTEISGEVSLKFEAAGTYKVMAYKDDGSIVPAVATVTVTGTGTVAPPTEQNAKVTFTLKGDTVHSGSLHSGTYYPTWIPATTVELSDSIKTVGDVFKKVLDANGYTYVGLNAGYISSITTPSGLKLAELDNGDNSGWMYMVNGTHPNVGLNDYVLSNGDVIIWHYTDNYKEEHDYAGPKEDQSSVTTTGASGSATTTTPTEVTVSGDTAKVTVKEENMTEAIKQAKANKSAEIVLNVEAADLKTATKVSAELTTAAVKQIANDTTAALAVKTPQGKAVISRETLSEIAKNAKGTSVTIEITQNSDEKLEVAVKSAGETLYTSLVEVKDPAEEEQAKLEKIKAGVKATTLIARSSKTKNGIKVTWTKSKGYKVDYYEVFRSTKKNAAPGTKPIYTTKNAKNPGTKTYYVNTKSLKKGTTYYYTVRGVRIVDGKKIYTKWSKKAIRTA